MENWKNNKKFWLTRSLYSHLIKLEERSVSNERKRPLTSPNIEALQHIEGVLIKEQLPDFLDVRHCQKINELGVFATKEIKEGDLLGIYASLIIPLQEAIESQFRFSYTWKHALDARFYGNYTRFFNSAYPGSERNLRAELVLIADQEEIAFFATKPIKPFQQCLVNYGEDYFKKFNIDPILLNPDSQ